MICSISVLGQTNYHGRAVSFINKKEFKKAEAIYREGIEKKPKDLFLRVSFGDLLMRQGRYDEAQKAYLQVIGRDSTYVLGYRRSGLGYYRVGNYRKALKRYKKGLTCPIRFRSNEIAICHGIGDCYAGLLKTEGLDSVETNRLIVCYEKYLGELPRNKDVKDIQALVNKVKANRPNPFVGKWTFP